MDVINKIIVLPAKGEIITLLKCAGLGLDEETAKSLYPIIAKEVSGRRNLIIESLVVLVMYSIWQYEVSLGVRPWSNNNYYRLIPQIIAALVEDKEIVAYAKAYYESKETMIIDWGNDTTKV